MNSHTHCNMGEEKPPDRTELPLLLCGEGGAWFWESE